MTLRLNELIDLLFITYSKIYQLNLNICYFNNIEEYINEKKIFQFLIQNQIKILFS